MFLSGKSGGVQVWAFLGGQDSECEPCLCGDFANCLNPVVSGITTGGGYAEMMIAEARARALASIPDELASAEAAPFALRWHNDLQRVA
jgi:D-arabinose 1-dehydrogenase-like Zn-dependent alcohol dehydrogenase